MHETSSCKTDTQISGLGPSHTSALTALLGRQTALAALGTSYHTKALHAGVVLIVPEQSTE